MASSQSSVQTGRMVADRYRLLRRIGEARSTETWEALDTRLERAVSLRLVARDARGDPGAQGHVRVTMRQGRLDQDPGSPRVLDGGEDPRYGPFVVAELNQSMEATRPLSVGDALVESPLAATSAPSHERPRPGYSPAPPASAVPARRGPRASGADPPTGGRVGVLALAVLAVVILVALAFLARVVLAPSEQVAIAPAPVTTPEQPARPRSGAPAGEPTPGPTVAPTLAAPGAQARPTPRPTAQPTTSPTAQPTPHSQAAAPGSPVDTIRQHYALINARRYADGYQLMDAHLRGLNTPADYASWFANKVSIQPVSIDLVSQTDGQAVVRSVVQTTDRVNGQDVTTQVSEQFVLRDEDGAWRIDQVSRV